MSPPSTGRAWFMSFLGRNETQAALSDSETDWSDMSSSTLYEIDAEDEARLLPHIPSLFSTDLPPCGPIPQVAYSNVVQRLRKSWLLRVAAATIDLTSIPTIPLLPICTFAKDNLENEAREFPPDSQRGTKARKPWRRENVFLYEIAWGRYFEREAGMLERRVFMSVRERERVEFSERMMPVPKELRLCLRRGPGRDGVLELWREWHAGKRGGDANGDGEMGEDARDEEMESEGEEEQGLLGDYMV
ncbi:Nn.00g069620.m01.CDS01 [Neocucurbitaria sp. VM-36]